jgi:hypothetical protein
VQAEVEVGRRDLLGVKRRLLVVRRMRSGMREDVDVKMRLWLGRRVSRALGKQGRDF